MFFAQDSLRTNSIEISIKKSTLFFLLCLHLLLWALIAQLTAPSLDPYGDMIEGYSWGQNLIMGTFKHPPMLAWINHAWFTLFPVSSFSYYILAYTNAAVGILGILSLARLFLEKMYPLASDKQKIPKTCLLLTLVFTMLSGAYSNYAAKYNADTILISFWPWITFAFFSYHYRSQRTRQKIGAIFLFSVLAAAGMLAKYFTGVLLLALFIVSLSDKKMRSSYATPYPYLAALLFLVFLWPHILWEYRMRFPFTQYFDSKVNSGFHFASIPHFLLSGVYQLPIAWLFFMLIYFGKNTKNPAIERIDFIKNHPIPRHLVLICILPAIITVCMSFFGVHLTSHWAIPIWFGLPIVMTMLLANKIPQMPEKKIFTILAIFWTIIFIFGLSTALLYRVTGNPTYTIARLEMVQSIERRFNVAFPHQNLSWAAGSWSESAALSFYLANHPIALPGYPNEMPALINPYADWKKNYGVVLCYNKKHGAVDKDDETCILKTRTWLENNHIPIREEKIVYHKQSARYSKRVDKAVTVFWVAPEDS